MWYSQSRQTRLAFAASLVLMTAFAHSPVLCAAAPERTLFADPPRSLSDLQLTSHEGKPLRLSQLRGAPVLLFFGFAHCPSVCPAALQQLRQLEQKHAAELGATRIVIVSVDGERDSPAAMKTWLQPISTSFIGLTGPPARVHDIAAQFSAAFYKTPGASAGEYSMEHNSQIFLLDAKGQLRATFFNAPLATMAAVTRDVASGS